MAAVVSGLSFGQEKLGLNHRLPFQRRRSSYSNFRIVRCGGLWQEIRDQERPLSLKRDDLGSFPNSGSIVSGKQGAPCGRLMPVQSYRHGNHLHRETSLLQPKRTRGVDCPVSLQRITPTTVRRAAWPKAGNIAELDPEGGPREFARQGNYRLSRTSFAFGSSHRPVGG
jgi:hypothetical protein